MVHSAGIQDRDGGISLLATMKGLFPLLEKLFADSAYQGPLFAKALAKILPRLSTHHPIHQATLLDPGYLRAELIEEEWDWLGEKMRYYRRPLRDLTEPLASAGYVIERISEPTPSEALKSRDPDGYELLCRLPAFI